VFLLTQPRTSDFAVQVFRAGLVEREGLAVWNGAWYAGHHALAYSLLTPPLSALLGPALVGALERFRTRMDVTWVPLAGPTSAAILIATVLATAATAPPAHADTQADAAAAKASQRYLLRAQNDDGGWGGAAGQRSTQLHTGWTALGLAAAGRNPRDAGRPSAVAYMLAHAGELNDLGELSRTILVLTASGLDPRDAAGRDLLAELVSATRPPVPERSGLERLRERALAVLRAFAAQGAPAAPGPGQPGSAPPGSGPAPDPGFWKR
jgi:hypothetical protein